MIGIYQKQYEKNMIQ